jgi:hypothetical protein
MLAMSTALEFLIYFLHIEGFVIAVALWQLFKPNEWLRRWTMMSRQLPSVLVVTDMLDVHVSWKFSISRSLRAMILLIFLSFISPASLLSYS